MKKRRNQAQPRQEVFSNLAMSAGNAFTLTARGDPEQLIGLHASATLLPAIGLEPLQQPAVASVLAA